jgi:5-methylcytosine-specific restriction enzyme A
MDRAARLKFYSSAPWRKMRKWYLSQHPLCERCKDEDGKLEPATEVDHKIPLEQRPDLALDPKNLQSLCKPCHSAKTLAEVTGRPVKRSRSKIWGFTPDGLPKDPNHPWNREPKEPK